MAFIDVQNKKIKIIVILFQRFSTFTIVTLSLFVGTVILGKHDLITSLK